MHPQKKFPPSQVQTTTGVEVELAGVVAALPLPSAPPSASSSDAELAAMAETMTPPKPMGPQSSLSPSRNASSPRRLLMKQGSKSWEEYHDVFGKRRDLELHAKLKRAFDSLDVDGSETISMHEIKHGLADVLGREIAPWEYRLIMKKLDTAGNNQISFNEFRDGFESLKGSRPTGIEAWMPRVHYHFTRIFHPLETVRRAWDFVLMAVLVYSLVEIPFKIGLNLEAEVFGTWWFFNLAVDIFFLVDIALFFRVGFLENDDCECSLVLLRPTSLSHTRTHTHTIHFTSLHCSLRDGPDTDCKGVRLWTTLVLPNWLVLGRSRHVPPHYLRR